MNITELARILKIPLKQLRQILPQLGFDIGQKAIKVDNQTANKIIRQWPVLIKQLTAKDQENKQEIIPDNLPSQDKKEIKIPAFITVRDFSLITGLPVNKILAELMRDGIFTSLNERIDFDTAAIIGADLGLEIKLDETQTVKTGTYQEKLKHLLDQESSKNLQPRPPVIVVMGHVDHGKTKLLDAIRKTDVVASEAGGITQHIGAYQIIHKNKPITFIDTPGHEAFTAMRNRGAKIADIAILVVAADDGVMPQTIEAYRIIETAKLPFVVAINKIDKPEANLEKTKQELSNQLKIIPEDWGGKTIYVPISAKQNLGINELLDTLLLVAEMEADNIKANPEAEAIGTIVESHLDKGEGPVATVLIQNGTLKIGDSLCFNEELYGKVRALKNHYGQNLQQAGPAVPVKIIGLKIAPEIGDILEVKQGEKLKLKKFKSVVFQPTVKIEEKVDEKVKKINLIIKSDVLGSGEAIEGSLAKIDYQSVKINIISKGLGNITEGDINRAEASQAKIIGFNVKVNPFVEELAREKSVEVKIYKIIYELINDIKTQAETLIEPEIKRVDLGKIRVLAIFRNETSGQIVGGKVIEGRIETASLIEIIRDKQLIGKGGLIKLQSGKQDVTSAEINQEAGVQYRGKPVIKIGDILQFYKEEKIIRKI